VTRILAEATTQRLPLSPAEQYMLSWSESDPGFTRDPALDGAFESETSERQSERKIVRVIRDAYARDLGATADARARWREAYTGLEEGDHLLEIEEGGRYFYVVVLTKVVMFGGNIVFAFHNDGKKCEVSSLAPGEGGFDICSDLLWPKREGRVKRLHRYEDVSPFWRSKYAKATVEYRLGVKAKEWFIYRINDSRGTSHIARVTELTPCGRRGPMRSTAGGLMAESVSLEGPVEVEDGQLVLRIPLAAGGDKLAPLARGIGEVRGGDLVVVVPAWLAEKLNIGADSLVVVDNREGKFRITRSAANDG
jgi:hypothetical protein